jgi:iron complex outermembrane recepter protein
MLNLRSLGLTSTLLACTLSVQAQQSAAIRGRVTTSDGSPAEAVTVGLKGRSQGAITNSRGEYVIERVRPGQYTLVISAVGLKSEEKAVTVEAGQSVLVDFALTENAEQLREVVISGSRTNKFARKQSEYVSKMPLSNLENPQVYATVGKELLTEQLVFTADDATRNVPGLQRMWEATGRAGDGGSYYNLRGFITQGQLRNGVAGGVTSSIDAANLEKLEVIKGPSATLFGSTLTSYGGLINRVTKKAYDRFGGEIAYSAGSFGLQRLSTDVNTPLDKQKKLLLRLNTAGQYERNFQNRGYQGFDKSLTIAPTLTYKPTERLTINLDAELYRTQGVGKQLIFFYFPTSALEATRPQELGLDYRQSYIGNGLSLNSRSSNYFAQVNYQLAPGFTSSTNFTHSRSFSDGFGAYFYVTPIADSISSGDPTRLGSTNFLSRADQSTRDSRAFTTEVQQLFNGDFQVAGLRNRVVLGLDYLNVDNQQTFFGSVFGAPVALGLGSQAYTNFNGRALAAQYAAGPPDFTYPITTQLTTYSAFASDVLNLTEKLSVLAAVRVDRFENKGGLVGGPVQPFKQTAVSPKFGVVYQPVKDKVSVFANYQNSFRSPGSYRAYNPAALSDSTELRTARLEQANQWEGGVKLDAFAGKLTTTLSYYAIRVENLLRTDPRLEAAAKFAQTQDGSQRSQGLELNVVANPFEGFNAVAGFSYNDSKLTRADESVNGRRPATASSPYLANLWLSYRLPAGPVQGLGLGVGGNYASENRIQNTSTNVFTLPSYTVLNASVFYDQPRFRLSAKVDNLTNQQYWIGYTTMNPQKVRSVVGSVAYKF